MKDMLPYLPHFQAVCNATAVALLLTGLNFIRQKNKAAHRACMLSALGVSVAFTVSYLTYHHFMGTFKFGGQGAVRTFYFFILATHTVLAAVILPMLIVTLYRAFKGNFEKHKKLARWTLGFWLYVSVTGVMIYWMLYHMHPGGA